MGSFGGILKRRTGSLPNPVDVLPRGLYWKELRQLQPVFWGLLGIELVVGLCLVHWPGDGGAIGIRLNRFVLAMAGCLGLFGALFHSTELEERTAPFLLRLPVSRLRLFGAKAAAGWSVWVLFVGASLLLCYCLREFWVPAARAMGLGARFVEVETKGHAEVLRWWLAFTILLVYFACAFSSLFTANTLVAFVNGVAVVVVFEALAMALARAPLDFSSKLGTYVAFLIVHLVPLCVVFRLFWKKFSRMEEALRSAEEKTAEFEARLASWGVPLGARFAPSLFSVEWREKRFLWLSLLALPFLLVGGGLLAYGFLDVGLSYEDLVTELPFLAGWAGVACGATLWGRGEREGAAFFVHHLPVSRGRLFWGRMASGGAFCLLYAALAIPFLSLSRHMPDLWLGDLGEWLVIGSGLAAIAWTGFLVGGALSPLGQGDLVRFIQSLFLSVLVIGPTCVLSMEDSGHVVWGFGPILVFLLALAWWMNVRSRAMEPGARNGGRVFLVGVLVVAWAVCVNLVDPLDLLYLLGVDVYGWL